MEHLNQLGGTLKPIGAVKTELCNTQDKDIAKDIRVEKISENGLAINSIAFNEGDNYFDVIVHGSGTTFKIILETATGKINQNISANQLATFIKEKLPPFNPLNPKLLRLLSCSNLASAKDLSKALGREVVASEGSVRLYKSGAVTSTSKWIRVNGCAIIDSDVNTSNWKKAGENEGSVRLGGSDFEEFEDMAELKKSLTLSGLKPTDVISKFKIENKEFYGVNTWKFKKNAKGEFKADDDAARKEFEDAGLKNPNTGKVPISTFCNHAEGDVFLQAFKSGSTQGKEAELYVDRSICGWCSKNLLSMKNALGLQKLNVYELINGQIKYSSY